MLPVATFLALAFAMNAVAQPAPASVPSRPKADYERAALRTEGDVARGKVLFFDERRLACSRCHTVDGTSGRAGPDLFSIGDKFGRREIVDAILRPSAAIAVGYSTTTVETKSGEEIQGILKQVTNEWLELALADGNSVRVPTRDITERRTTDVSLMPEELHAGLTLQEFTDVIEYLVSLKQPESASLVDHGMPAVIQEAPRPVELRPFHSASLRFTDPVFFGQVPGASNTFVVVEHQTGRIWLFDKASDRERKTLFLDLGTNVIRGGTRGLIGFAFHPKFRENRKYYIAVSTNDSVRTATITIEREAAADFQSDSGKPSKRILEIEAATNVHYGGAMLFGPDGFLYVGMGDTGPQEDPQGHGQNLGLLRGKIMRIDVGRSEAGRAYAIPRDNPFIGVSGVRPEIWALGFREPWRLTFDPVTHDLWVGDVGQDRYEEIGIVRRGENYGWNVYEGFEPFSNRYRRSGGKFVPPVFAYARKYGVSVTGGYVYRGDPRSSFYGVYVFGDYQSRRIWGLTQENRVLKKVRQIGMAPERIVSFAEDASRNLYVVGYEGTIFKMDFDGAGFE